MIFLWEINFTFMQTSLLFGSFNMADMKTHYWDQPFLLGFFRVLLKKCLVEFFSCAYIRKKLFSVGLLDQLCQPAQNLVKTVHIDG